MLKAVRVDVVTDNDSVRINPVEPWLNSIGVNNTFEVICSGAATNLDHSLLTN